ncbi:CYFA0S19e01420g1_1 [Cyberlindnera fabianii]|uniref:CYFA0S19e01420g1_1 n=1 Tax=Cyberlindnera fabianii TaxID=36022 RepID=A0A061BF96_CYBFA|nr:Protein HOL1 [Cyberlindnera fabianii]CDR45651.1 CYFA0S19e01420g1_1 [Cyberlindnera fabianii]
MDQYTNKYHPDFIPGTTNIYSSNNLENGVLYKNRLKKDGDVILIPQPSDSPNDPLNWSKTRKMAHFAVMAFVTAFTAATSNDAGSTQDSLNEMYGISYDSMNTGAGVLFLGIGYGTLFLAPLSYLYGRKLPYLISIGLGLIGAVWFGYSKDTNDTIWSQLFVGISESCAEAAVQLSLTDIFFQHQLGSVLTVYILSTAVGTYLSPLIGNFMSNRIGFRWVGWSGAIISGALMLVLLFLTEETAFERGNYITPLTSKQSVNGVDSGTTLIASTKASDSGDEKSINFKEKDYSVKVTKAQMTEELIDGSKEQPFSYWRRVQPITKASNLKGTGFRQYWMYVWANLRMFTFPGVILSGLFWGIQNAFLSFYLTTEDTFFYDDPYNYTNVGVALMNIPCLVGSIVGCFYAGTISDYFTLWMARRNNGIVEAEFRLYFALLTAVFGSAGLLMFGIGAERMLNKWVMYIGLAFIGFAYGSGGDIALSYSMEGSDLVLESMVCVAVINNTISCIFTFTCSLWLEASGTENVYIALAVINLAVMGLAIPMIIWGKKTRKWTRKYYLEFLEFRDGI